MIESFVDSWALFHDVYLAGWLIATLLGLAGVMVVARDQIFLGAAIAEASLLGITVGMRFGPAMTGGHAGAGGADLVHSLFGGAFAVGGSLLVEHREDIGESREAITGWLFLVGASVSVLLVANSPHGMAEVHRLLASSIIGASRLDVVVFTLLLAVAVAVVVACRDTLLLLVMDPEMARAVGVRVDAWNRLLAVWLGVVVALAIHSAGVVYAFGCLVLPALAAKHLCREVGRMLVIAPLVALAGSIIACVVANHYDYPPGQLAVALLALAVTVAWSVRRLAR